MCIQFLKNNIWIFSWNKQTLLLSLKMNFWKWISLSMSLRVHKLLHLSLLCTWEGEKKKFRFICWWRTCPTHTVLTWHSGGLRWAVSQTSSAEQAEFTVTWDLSQTDSAESLAWCVCVCVCVWEGIVHEPEFPVLQEVIRQETLILEGWMCIGTCPWHLMYRVTSSSRNL